MSATRTRVILGDDSDLLGAARSAILARADFDVTTGTSNDEVLKIAAGSPAPRAAILPADGRSIDGLALCRTLRDHAKSDLTVILVLPAGSPRRDECFMAGADDVAFAPADATDLAIRIEAKSEAKNGVLPFRNTARANVPLQVNLQTANGSVVQGQVSQTSREALLVSLPPGMNPPPPYTLLRAVFTLYEGGTLTVWVRSAPAPDPPRCVLRFVGLTAAELQALDYFVDFYNRTPSTVPAEEVSGPHPAATTASTLPETKPAPTSDVTDQTIQQVISADVGVLAGVAERILGSRAEIPAPAGYNMARLRSFVPRLAPTEASALRGTTMYNDLLGELRECSGTKLMILELAAQFKTGGAALDQNGAAAASARVIADAESLHDRMQLRLQARLKSGDTKAMRDLNPVTAGLLNACSELKFALDRHVLGQAPPATPQVPLPASAGPALYSKAERAPVEPSKSQAGNKKAPAAPAGPMRTVLISVLLIGGLAGSVWSNRALFFGTPPPPEFVAPSVEFQVGEARVWMSTNVNGVYTLVVDDSWKKLDDAAREAALAEFARRGAPKAQLVRVRSASGQTLAEVPIVASN